MVEAILLDRRRILPCAAYLQGEYGIDGLFVGVPVVLGNGGMEKVIEISLTDEEKGQLADSAAAVRELVETAAGLTVSAPVRSYSLRPAAATTAGARRRP